MTMKTRGHVARGSALAAVTAVTFVLGCETTLAATTAATAATTTTTTTTASAAGLTCQENRKAAVDLLQAAIAGHQTCAQDSDCVPVGRSAGCFDGCTSYINAAGLAEAKAAVEQANASYCAAYTQQRCPPPVVPPCVPPAPPRCTSGACGG